MPHEVEFEICYQSFSGTPYEESHENALADLMVDNFFIDCLPLQ
jgi:hypothetical protein